MPRDFSWNIRWEFLEERLYPTFTGWKIGPLNQERGLTLAIKQMNLRTRGVYSSEIFAKFNSLMKFIIEVYAVSGVEIKSSITSNCIFSI